MPATARLLCLLLLLTACRSHIPYIGAPLADRAEAQRVIRQTLEEQRLPYAPIEVDVSADRFHVIQSRDTRKPVGVAVYYSRIGRVDLSKRKTVYAVSIYAEGGAFLMHVYAYDRASAERFIDALATMRRAT